MSCHTCVVMQQDQALNIQERLHRAEWHHDEDVFCGAGQWWQQQAGPDGALQPAGEGDRSEQVNRLRTMARVRAAFRNPDTGAAPEWARDFPRMIVVGDGNTGKSTVLNRFAGFNFSAVSDGVCTRRPIRLELRAPSARNHRRIKNAGLDAICTITELREQVDEPRHEPRRFELREGNSDEVRREVERLASAKDPAHGADPYTKDELVIRYEAPGMIHFDLVDLPGIDNSFNQTTELVQEYIRPNRLDNTFILIFQAATRGSTAMRYSVSVNLIKACVKECAHLGRSDWLGANSSHCLGALTMYDMVLAPNPDKPASQYDSEAAEKLAGWLNKIDHTHDTLKHDWVTVLVRMQLSSDVLAMPLLCLFLTESAASRIRTKKNRKLA